MLQLEETKIKKRHYNKLNKIRNKQRPCIESVKSILSPITNLSKSKTLTDKEINILENGLNFVLPDNKFDEMTFISNIETFFVELLGHCTDKKDYEEKDVDEEIKYNLTPIQLQCANKIRSICNNFRYNADKIINKHKHETNQFKNVLKNLSKDKSILITKPDKGKGIVIIDKDEYNNKMLELLNDRNTFKVVEFDETITLEDKLIRKLKQLKNDGFITDKEYNFCRPRGSQPARIYGLPKIHKAGVPLRPIVSATGTFNYKLAKLLANKLDYLRKNKTIIKDTFTFVDELLSLKFDNSQIKLISFDITSLFTKVPLNRTIQIILDKLYGSEHTCTYSNLKRDDWCSKCKNRFEMKYLLDTSTKETNFIFNNKIYSQINGVAMGSPLGPLFADIYVNYIEDKLMPRLKRNGLLYWRRFVNDTFAVVKKDVEVENLIEILNSFDNDIVFTYEEEKNSSLPFLDIYITRLPNNSLTNKKKNTPKFDTSNNKLNNNRNKNNITPQFDNSNNNLPNHLNPITKTHKVNRSKIKLYNYQSNNNITKSYNNNTNNTLSINLNNTTNTSKINHSNSELNINLTQNNINKSRVDNSENNLSKNSNTIFKTSTIDQLIDKLNVSLSNKNIIKSQVIHSNINLPNNSNSTTNTHRINRFNVKSNDNQRYNNNIKSYDDKSNNNLSNTSKNITNTSKVHQMNSELNVDLRNNPKVESHVDFSNNNLSNNLNTTSNTFITDQLNNELNFNLINNNNNESHKANSNNTINTHRIDVLNSKSNDKRRINNNNKSHADNSNNDLPNSSNNTINTYRFNRSNIKSNDNLRNNNNNIKSYADITKKNLPNTSNNTFNTTQTNQFNNELNDDPRNNNIFIQSHVDNSDSNIRVNSNNTTDTHRMNVLNIKSNNNQRNNNNIKSHTDISNNNVLNNLNNTINNNSSILTHHNPKIISFINSILNSNKMLLNNLNNRSKNNPPSNQFNTSNNNTTIISTINSKIKSNNRLNKKSFANLKVNSDKQLIRKSVNLLNINQSNDINNMSNKAHLFNNSILDSRINSSNTQSTNVEPTSTIISKDDIITNLDVVDTDNITTNKSVRNLITNQALSSLSSNTISISSKVLTNKIVKFSIINPIEANQSTNSNTLILNQSILNTSTNTSQNPNKVTNVATTNKPLIKSFDNNNFTPTIICNTSISNEIIDSKIISNSNDKSFCNLNNNINNCPVCTSTVNISSNSVVIPTDTLNNLNYTNSFSTTIYRKPTYTGLITKWNSFIPHAYKVSTISSMIYRAIRICSSYQSMHEEFQFIEFIGELNGYPKNFMRSQIRKTLNRYIEKSNGTQTYKSKDKITPINDHSSNKRHIFIDIPFVGKPTDIFKKQITKIAKTIDPIINLQPIQRPPSSLSNYFPLKDPIPKLLKSKVVYKLNCNNCDAMYIGKTIRHVSRRLQEHGAEFNKINVTNSNPINSDDNQITLRRSDRNKNKVINYFPELSIIDTHSEQNKPINSAAKQHENNNNHKIDWINFDIIATDNKNYQLLVKESLLINSLKPTLNRTTTSVPLIIYPEGITCKPKVKIKSTVVVPSLDVV